MQTVAGLVSRLPAFMPLVLSEARPENFFPLTLTRATFELRYGALSPLERALRKSPQVVLRCRPELAPYVRARTGLPVNEDIAPEDLDGEPFPGLPGDTPWDVLAQSDKLITADLCDWQADHENHRDTALMPGAHIVGDPENVHIGEGSIVQPGCVLDATGGPIIMASRVLVKWSNIQGPAFIGHGCILDGARVRPGTSLGPHCKIGGEIAATIFQSRVNKAHDGFVGHTWAGRWVNFGAGSTTSNLKNTYGTIRYQRDAKVTVETGRQFLGSIIGDHTKIGIGQLLNTGSNLGVGCNVFGGSVTHKYIPSFMWGGAGGWQEQRLESFLRAVRATLERRSTTLRPESEAVLRLVFERTAKERAALLASTQ
jgi:UDP-N-acetylglucosamine diphosphorylase/glucosamine-1-phosphate N-acetyltransferase